IGQASPGRVGSRGSLPAPNWVKIGQTIAHLRMHMTEITDPTYAQQLDAQDPLAHFRERFVIEDPDLIYLDGNSLGRLPQKSTQLAQDLVTRQWGQRLIRGWNEGWIDLQAQIGGKIGQLIGARADEVIVADSTSLNLFKLALAAVQYNNG